MTELRSNLVLNKGDLITEIEVSPMWDSEQQTYNQVRFTHLFRIDRVNKKTYSCTYIDPTYKGIGFKWVKTTLFTHKKQYFINRMPELA